MLYRSIIVLSLLLVSKIGGAASPDVSSLPRAQTHEVPESGMPLGGVWVHTLPEPMQAFHARAVHSELSESHASDKRCVLGGDGSIPTNIALFSVRAYIKRDTDSPVEAIELLSDFSEVIYRSGGHIHLDPKSPELFGLVEERDRLKEERKRLTASIAAQTTNLSKLSGLIEKDPRALMEKLRRAPEEIGTLLDDLERIKEKTRAVACKEKEFEEGCDVFEARRAVYLDYKKQIYDPEQVIARLVDVYMMHATADDDTIVFGDIHLPKGNLVRIGVHLHSRLDLCPYCVMFLHHKTKGWNTHIKALTGRDIVSTFVSSRQEYISSSPFLLAQPFYRGSSMRSIGLSAELYRSDLDDARLSELSSQGIVIQIVFRAHELY